MKVSTTIFNAQTVAPGNTVYAPGNVFIGYSLPGAYDVTLSDGRMLYIKITNGGSVANPAATLYVDVSPYGPDNLFYSLDSKIGPTTSNAESYMFLFIPPMVGYMQIYVIGGSVSQTVTAHLIEISV